MPQGTKVIRTMTPAQTVELLRSMGMPIEVATLQYGIQQGKYYFGEAIKCDKHWCYKIYVKLLNKWIDERAEEDDFGNWTPPQ